MDILPTLVDLLGLPSDSMLNRIDGMSIKPLLAAETGPRTKPIPFHYQNGAALIDNDLKIVQLSGGKPQLFDLKADRTESQDLIDERPGDARHLRGAQAHRCRTFTRQGPILTGCMDPDGPSA